MEPSCAWSLQIIKLMPYTIVLSEISILLIPNHLLTAKGLLLFPYGLFMLKHRIQVLCITQLNYFN